MLTLQRASAGSGKTYTLTRNYIELLITIPAEDGSGRRRLRKEKELADSGQHILAVTFTNKATNEMKERILAKLNDLAYPPDLGNPLKPDYMREFCEKYGVGHEEISRVCREALRQVLYNYSDFNISTIDSFFQNILRTFAYESDLPDSYQLIIDSADVSRVAARELVDDYASGRIEEDEKEWLGDEIKDKLRGGENAWSLFQRREKGSQKNKNLYSSLCDMADSLEKEEFKSVRTEIEDYLDRGYDLREEYLKIADRIADRYAVLYSPVRAAAMRAIEAYKEVAALPEMAAIATRKTGRAARWEDFPCYASYFPGRLKNIVAKDADPQNVVWKHAGKKGEKVFGGDYKKFSCRAGEVESALEDLDQAYEAWAAFHNSEFMGAWRLMQPGIPRLALMLNLRRRVARFLAENDAMQIADTNTMLRRIINDDDVPFIYERTGSRINHFLIDEFQDTSLLQWKNFHPLLSESMGNGNENLIIGDAKQSIYRFRNAEPKLITDIVPASFEREQLRLRGYSESDNANWRSLPEVVRFNNMIFSKLSARLDSVNAAILAGTPFSEISGLKAMPEIGELYGNTVQKPMSKKGVGYVEVGFFDEKMKLGEDVVADAAGSEQEFKLPETILAETARIVESLLRRGFRQRDIAILVNTKAAGEEIITYLMDYGRIHAGEMPNLQFVSEDSLKLGRSRAVQEIMECFKLIQSGIEGDMAGQTSADENKINWVEIGHKFSHYSAAHPNLSLHERLETFLNQEYADERLDELVDGMQAVTLPSLLENIAEKFVPEDLRAQDAPFIAALQDAVLDYCDAYPTDIASMLRWWERTGQKISISSAENSEAISVMTIHKSKGLEYECVICPELNLNFNKKEEWVWMEIPADSEFGGVLPKMLPMVIKGKIPEDVSFRPAIEQYVESQYLHEVDMINKAYVALTRAVAELYVLLPAPKNKGGNAGVKGKESRKSSGKAALPESTSVYMYEILEETGNLKIYSSESSGNEELERPEELPDALMASYAAGEKVSAPAEYIKEKEKRGEIANSNPEALVGETERRDITDYYVNSSLGILHYNQEGKEPKLDKADDDRIDPRSEGTLLHGVLEHVEVESDLQRAFRKMRARGLMTREDAAYYTPILQKALESVRARGWFDGRYQVFNEHPIVRPRMKFKRPDRLMLDSSGKWIIVDYKFGSSDNHSEHLAQVREYMELISSASPGAEVEGYLWYVLEDGGKIESVESL